MRERIIILGAGVMQGPAMRLAREMGLEVAAVDGSPDAPCVGMADIFEKIDLKDKEGVEAFARALRDGTGGLGGIMTAGTDFSATVAWVAERLGLPGVPYETALDASDKGRMRARLSAAGLPSPAFATVDSAEGLAPPAPFPLVVKPVDNMGGRGCRRADGPDELREAVRDALRHSRSGRAIVEAFLEGPEFSVDAIVHRGEIVVCGLADRHVLFPPFFVEMGHTMPSAFPPERREAVLEAFRAGVRALGLADAGNVGAAKGDVKLTPAGPVVGEIAARLSGGYMSGWTFPYSSGAESIRAAISLAVGRGPGDLSPSKAMTSAERAFVSIPGTVAATVGAGEALAEPFARDLFLRVRAGDKVRFPENNVSKCGNAISAAPDRASAIESAERAARAVLIRLDPADPETDRFLRGEGAFGGGFPPSAFALDPALRDALDALPDTEAPAGPPKRADAFALVPFPEFAESGLRDLAGRPVAEALDAVRRLVGLPLPETLGAGDDEIGGRKGESADNESVRLGRPFWAALARGSYQGAAYYVDRLRGKK